MALTNEQYEKIGRYLSAEMTKEEEVQFLGEVTASEEMQQELDLIKIARGQHDVYRDLPGLFNALDVEDEEYRTRKQQLKNLRTRESGLHNINITNIKPLKSPKWMVAASVAALIVLILAAAYYISRQGSLPVVKKPGVIPGDSTRPNEKNDSLKRRVPENDYPVYDTLYTRYQPGDVVPVELQNAVANYKEGKYVLAVSELADIGNIRGNELPNRKELRAMAFFYSGLCYLELTKNEEAYEQLRQAYLSRKLLKSMEEDAAWYFALACLKTKKPTEAETVLQQMNAGNVSGKYKAKISFLLKQF